MCRISARNLTFRYYFRFSTRPSASEIGTGRRARRSRQRTSTDGHGGGLVGELAGEHDVAGLERVVGLLHEAAGGVVLGAAVGVEGLVVDARRGRAPPAPAASAPTGRRLALAPGVLQRQRRRRRGRRRRRRPLRLVGRRVGARRVAAGRPGGRGGGVTASVDTGSAGSGGSGRYSATTRGGTSGGASVGSGAGADGLRRGAPGERPGRRQAARRAATTRGSMPVL